MASIATVVTLGYGSFGSVNLLPTLGYGIGEEAESGEPTVPVLSVVTNRGPFSSIPTNRGPLSSTVTRLGPASSTATRP